MIVCSIAVQIMGVNRTAGAENAECEFGWMYLNFMYQAGFFVSSFYRFILLKQFHFVEKKYSLALGKPGSSHCLVEAVMFMQYEKAPAAEMMACQTACLEETSWKVKFDLKSLTLSQLIVPHHWSTHAFLSERIWETLFLFSNGIFQSCKNLYWVCNPFSSQYLF